MKWTIYNPPREDVVPFFGHRCLCHRSDCRSWREAGDVPFHSQTCFHLFLPFTVAQLSHLSLPDSQVPLRAMHIQTKMYETTCMELECLPAGTKALGVLVCPGTSHTCLTSMALVDTSITCPLLRCDETRNADGRLTYIPTAGKRSHSRMGRGAVIERPWIPLRSLIARDLRGGTVYLNASTSGQTDLPVRPPCHSHIRIHVLLCILLTDLPWANNPLYHISPIIAWRIDTTH